MFLHLSDLWTCWPSLNLVGGLNLSRWSPRKTVGCSVLVVIICKQHVLNNCTFLWFRVIMFLLCNIIRGNMILQDAQKWFEESCLACAPPGQLPWCPQISTSGTQNRSRPAEQWSQPRTLLGDTVGWYLLLFDKSQLLTSFYQFLSGFPIWDLPAYQVSQFCQFLTSLRPSPKHQIPILQCIYIIYVSKVSTIARNESKWIKMK